MATLGRSDRPWTRALIYMAAVELIAEQGYTATTVDAIADRAGALHPERAHAQSTKSPG